MPAVIEPELIEADELPSVWSPVQWELTPDERAVEVEEQATASLILSADVPEAILRLLLREAEIEQSFEPPDGYDPEQQGEWDYNLVTYQFKRRIRLVSLEREEGSLFVEYDCGALGHWAMEISPEEFNFYKI